MTSAKRRITPVSLILLLTALFVVISMILIFANLENSPRGANAYAARGAGITEVPLGSAAPARTPRAPFASIIPQATPTPSLVASATPASTDKPRPSATVPPFTPEFFSAGQIAVMQSTSSSNLGLFTYYDGWIYFRGGLYREGEGSSYGLYRVRSHGSDVEKVYDSAHWYMNADQNYLYFMDHLKGRRLVRVSRNAPYTAQFLTDFKVSDLVLVGTDLYGSDVESDSLFRLDTNTGNIEYLLNERVSSITADDYGLIWFVRGSDDALCYYDTRQGYYRSDGILLDVRSVFAYGDYLFVLSQDLEASLLIQDGETIAYSSIMEDAPRMDSVVCDGRRLYFANEDDDGVLYSMDLQNGSLRKLCDEPVYHLAICGDWLYFINTENNTSSDNDIFSIWRCRTDGSFHEEVVMFQ